MAKLSQTVYVCDRCGEQRESNHDVHRVRLTDKPLSSGMMAMNYSASASWSDDLESVDLCEGCYESLEALWKEWVAEE